MFVAMNLDSFASYLYKPHSAKHTYESTVKQNNRSFHMLVNKNQAFVDKMHLHLYSQMFTMYLAV